MTLYRADIARGAPVSCARFIWNAKCDEDKYFRGFARKFTPYNQYYETQDQKDSAVSII